MCLILAIVSLVLCYRFFATDNLALALFSLVVAIFFIGLMVKNIKYVRKLKNKD